MSGRIDALEPDRDRADKAHSQGRRIEGAHRDKRFL